MATDQADELKQWWMEVALQDFQQQLPKMHEYGGRGQGSADLHVIGDNLRTLLGWAEATDAVLQELGVWFYTQGKTARLISDYQSQSAGRPDTWHDVTVYSMMARRLQAVGRWP